MFLRKMTLIFLVLSFLGLPHDQISGRAGVALFITGCQIMLYLLYLVDSLDEFIRNRDTSKKVRNYLWLSLPIGAQVALSMPYVSTVLIIWLSVLAVLVVIKIVNIGKGVGNGHKIVDGFFASGFPMG